MKIITTLFTLLLSSSLFAAPKHVTIDFSSFGAGINHKLYDEVTEILEIEKDFKNVFSVQEDQWGLEGEVQLCISADLRNMSRLARIFKILSQEDATTSVSFTHYCGG